ncbi:MAG: tripartite tricarboxylate transporter TctB family protein [Pseudomonadota bacterium]
MSALIYIALIQDFSRYPEGLTYLFPAVLFALTLCVGIALLRPQPQGQPDVEGAEKTAPRKMGSHFVGVALFSWGYLWVVTLIGFPLATILLQAGVLRFVFGQKGFLWLVIVPILMTILFTIFFNTILSVSLPRGMEPFYSLNALII